MTRMLASEEGTANIREFADTIRQTIGRYQCSVCMEWNGSFHASNYEIVAITGEPDKKMHADVIACNTRKEVMAAFNKLRDQRVAAAVRDWENSRDAQ